LTRQIDRGDAMEILMAETLAAGQIIDLRSMQPHPEGGHYVETFRDTNRTGGDTRSACTAIYYLLQAGETSAWHRLTDACEIWHWYAGAPLALHIGGRRATC
jgi:predicted cupin superfamily sugar epimerase